MGIERCFSLFVKLHDSSFSTFTYILTFSDLVYFLGIVLIVDTVISDNLYLANSKAAHCFVFLS